MQDHNLLSRPGLIAGAACAVIPLAMTGVLLFRYATQKSPIDELLIWIVVVVFAVLPAQLLMNRELGKYYKQRLAGGDAPPTRMLELLYGAAHGLIVSLAGMVLALLWIHFGV